MRHLQALFVLLLILLPVTAHAQRTTFERVFEIGADQAVEVTTERGRIDVVTGAPGRVVVQGTVTVRVGFSVPANALDLARQVSDQPPVERVGNVLRLNPPKGDDERRAVTVSYQVQIPPGTSASLTSDSGAISSTGVTGRLSVRTQSSAVSVKALTGDLFVRTESGAVDASFAGPGNLDVQTGSSAITLRGVTGMVQTGTRSGHTTIEGRPASRWLMTTGSGAIDVVVSQDAGFALDAQTGSGSVRLVGLSLRGTTSKGLAQGQVGVDGPTVTLQSRSGSIRVERTAGVIR